MKKQRRKSKITAGQVLLTLLVYLLGTACGFVLFGGLTVLFRPSGSAIAPGYRAAGAVQALRVQPPSAPDAETQRRHFADAVAFAHENGYNTLIFEAKPAFAASWQDDIFPTAAQGDSLTFLFQATAGKEMQVWLEINAFSASDPPAQTEALAAKHLAETGAEVFSPTDAEYRKLLVKSLTALPQRYPVGGFVFTGFAQGEAADSDGARYCLGVQALLEELHTTLADDGRLVPLGLVAQEKGSRLSPGFAAKLAQDGLASFILPQMQAELPALGHRLAAYGQKGVLASPLAGDGTGLFFFTAAQSPATKGMVVGSWPDADAAKAALATAQSATLPVDAPLPAGFELPQLLGVSYPAQNAALTTKEVFVMGSSDPAQPLLLDGIEVGGRGQQGLFGVAVPLEMGENAFTFSQGERSVTLRVTRTEPEAKEKTYPEDGTNKAKKGQVVVVSELIASALKDPNDSTSVNETFARGSAFVVEDSVQVKFSGKTTWAYRLKSGDFILGEFCRLVPGDGAAHFTALSATADEKGEWIDFSGSGTPGAYIEYKPEGLLRLTFYDTLLEGAEGFQSGMVQGARTEANANGSVSLELQVPSLWGYSLEYTDAGQMRLYLKRPPAPSDDPQRPLAGVTVMLDPGHGDTDMGSPGVLWETGPHEKDMNLALAQAVSYRLQQLGATVVMTRDGETFPTLQDRLAAQTQQKPDYFISIHHNAREPDADLNGIHGSEGYYFHPYSVPSSRLLAQNLMDTVPAFTGREYRKDAEWGRYYVTRTTVCPSVLFEYGYAMNPAEYGDITSADGLYAAAFATGQALVSSLPQ